MPMGNPRHHAHGGGGLVLRRSLLRSPMKRCQCRRPREGGDHAHGLLRPSQRNSPRPANRQNPHGLRASERVQSLFEALAARNRQGGPQRGGTSAQRRAYRPFRLIITRLPHGRPIDRSSSPSIRSHWPRDNWRTGHHQRWARSSNNSTSC
jgi:hypothetical protein